jgi:hypothetical protein
MSGRKSAKPDNSVNLFPLAVLYLAGTRGTTLDGGEPHVDMLVPCLASLHTNPHPGPGTKCISISDVRGIAA